MRSTWAAGGWLAGLAGVVALGCAGAGGASSSRSGGGGSSSSGGAAFTCTGCAATEGCIRVAVSRNADESTKPWTVWPQEADGQGTLVVGATAPNTTTVLARQTVANANFTAGTAHDDVDLNCLAPGSLQVRAFLDDNNNASATTVQSSDYPDTCQNTPMRYVAANVTRRPGDHRGV